MVTRPATEPPGVEESAANPPLPLEPPTADGGVPGVLQAPPAEDGPLVISAPVSSWQGPVFVVTKSSAGIYAEPKPDRQQKLGYARAGGHLPVREAPQVNETCQPGWYELVEGGFICGLDGTVDTNAPAARLATTEPNLNAVLPYPYARNARNGTPLYNSVPSDDQIVRYEAYLYASAQKSRAARDKPDAGVSDENAPWWQREAPRLSDVRLEHLQAESDVLLAKRMVRGFYIAVDREFEWNNRTWYRTTKGLVAPKDRFWVAEVSDFHGSALGGDLELPVAWVYGPRKDRPKYSIDLARQRRSNAGTVARFQAIPLSGESATVGNRAYLQTADGFWIDPEHVRIAEPRTPPANLDPNERWIDVDLSSQTLVAYWGTRPVYATLVSSGKESDDPEKDHKTPIGEWRIREKHITTTMDGDGTAAGDLPYSIEDVPYVMYYHRSYALHGAFWHQNYGVRMSHGCVNLAPLDAKWLFFFTAPQAHSGWHGAWPNTLEKGSRVVIHD
jgi:hypothetical protein